MATLQDLKDSEAKLHTAMVNLTNTVNTLVASNTSIAQQLTAALAKDELDSDTVQSLVDQMTADTAAATSAIPPTPTPVAPTVTDPGTSSVTGAGTVTGADTTTGVATGPIL